MDGVNQMPSYNSLDWRDVPVNNAAHSKWKCDGYQLYVYKNQREQSWLCGYNENLGRRV